MTALIKERENKTKPIEEVSKIQDAPVRAQAGQVTTGVEQRIAHMEVMQKFQLISKKRSRPFWKKMLSIK